jgi:hypothetical protein
MVEDEVSGLVIHLPGPMRLPDTAELSSEARFRVPEGVSSCTVKIYTSFSGVALATCDSRYLHILGKRIYHERSQITRRLCSTTRVLF